MKPFKAIAVAIFSAQLALAHIALVGIPAYASLGGELRKGEKRYIEVKIEPGRYALLVSVLPEGEASFRVYENNGRLIGESGRFDRGKIAPVQGLVVEASRPLVAHIWLQMDTCESACYFQVLALKRTSQSSQSVTFPSKILASRPSYRVPSSPKPENRTPPRQSGTSISNQYVFNTNSYINTNLSVNPGDKIRVEASGRVRFGAFVGAGGPRGIIISPQYNYFTDVPHGQLIGRIKQPGAEDLEGWFPIAEGREFVVRSSGVLEFAVNDNRPGDNSGSFRIQVTIEPAK
jgi:hypothetical protein